MKRMIELNPSLAWTALLGIVCPTLIAFALASKSAPAASEAHGNVPVPSGGPIGAIHAHVCGFHFYSGDMKRALRVDHYCSHADEGVLQCVIYDSAEKNARLIGIEYIIGEALFRQLPADEKRLWHSHRYEVMSGLLTAPEVPAAAEQKLMADLVNTYGKTWHLWQVDRGDKLPLGLPQLMMGFTADGQVAPALVAERDRELKIDSAGVKARRAGLPARPIAAGADAWQSGSAFQIEDPLPRATSDPVKP